METSAMMAQGEPWAAASRCILLVEDELLIRLFLSDELRDAGFQVIEAFNADEALVILGSLTPDVLISDVRMPGSLDGLGLLAIVKESLPALPVIIISSHLEAQTALAAGATEFIQKPFESTLIIDAVQNLLGANP